MMNQSFDVNFFSKKSIQSRNHPRATFRAPLTSSTYQHENTFHNEEDISAVSLHKPLLGRVTNYNRSFYQQAKPTIAAKRTITDKFNSSLMGTEYAEEKAIVRKAKEVAEQRVRNNRGKLVGSSGLVGRQKSAEVGSRVAVKQRYKLI